MTFVYAVGILFLASASLFGWGELVRRIARMPALAWPLTIALGLGAVLAMGGALNLARLAYAVTLWIVAATGLLLWIAALWKRNSPCPRLREAIWTKQTPSGRFEALSTGSFILVIISFAILTQLPPDVFNFHDDFQKYFAHPVRQLASGTLLGSPLSALGSETLGGMPFLQSFVLSIAPLPYINRVDAVFGLGLAMSLGAVAGWRRMAPLPGALLAPLLMAAIEPQYVNVSALYLGGALMAACVMLTLGLQNQAIKPAPLALGLLYAGLVALKPVFGIFPALHLPLAAIAFSVAGGSMRDSMSWLLRVLLWSTLFIAPWIALHVPNYAGVAHIATGVIPQGPAEIVDLFSTDRLFYGASMAAYTGLLGLAFLAAAWGVFHLRQQTLPEDRARSANLVASALTVILVYVILVLALSPILAGANTNLRYSMPFLVGIVPIVVVYSVRKVSNWPVYASAGVPLLFALVVIAAFVPSLIERYQQAVEYRTILAFSGSARNPAFRHTMKCRSRPSGPHSYGNCRTMCRRTRRLSRGSINPSLSITAETRSWTSSPRAWQARGRPCRLPSATSYGSIEASAFDSRRTMRTGLVAPAGTSGSLPFAHTNLHRSSTRKCATARPCMPIRTSLSCS